MSTNPSSPFKVHVWVCGQYGGFYNFATREEAEADYRQRTTDFAVLGCYYELETPATIH